MVSERHRNIEQKIKDRFKYEYLEILNESHNHSRPGDETHFRVLLVAPDFEGVPPLKRHQMVQELLKREFETGLHALSLHTFTLAEWQAQSQAPASPRCRGGTS